MGNISQALTQSQEVCEHCHRLKTTQHATFNVVKESVLGFDAIVCVDYIGETKVTMVKQLTSPEFLKKMVVSI